MKQMVRVALLSALAASGAQANSGSIFYGGIHGEVGYVSDADLDINGTKAGELEQDVEYTFGITAGYVPPLSSGFWSNTRYEVEVMYRETDFNDLSGSTIAPGGFGGSIETYVGMLNAYYDFHNSSSWTPYIGAGVGYGQHQYDSITISVDDDDTVFAYQAMAGLAYNIEPYDFVQIGLGYRYFGTEDVDVRTAGGASVEQSYDGHNLEGFLRIGF